VKAFSQNWIIFSFYFQIYFLFEDPFCLAACAIKLFLRIKKNYL